MPLPRLNIFEKMRGLYTPVIDIRRRVLSAVARMVVKDLPPTHIEHIPYQIIDKDTPTYRESVFKERAVVRERVRLAFGMDLKEFGAHGPINDDDVIYSLTDKKVINKPIVNVIKVGCERCPEHSFIVTDLCRGCIAHPCTIVCPKNAVSIINNRSVIDQDLCIRCGKCEQVCPYNAIAYRERPCAAACGVKAISSDENGFAEIDQEKCVSCGMCIVSCPFGAIAEKSEIVQIITALKGKKPVIAEIAPAFVSQFGPLVTPGKLKGALKEVGFSDVREVAYGADVVVMNETEELIELIKKRENCKEGDGGSETKCRTFIGTSCCTSWAMAAENNFPELSKLNISESFAPMVEIAKKIKKDTPDAIVVFIGPCISKKEECFIPEVAEVVDFVMTFEELVAIFQAFTMDPTKIPPEKEMKDASALGRGFPVAGGVAKAVLEQTKAIIGEDIDIPIVSADTLKECMSLLRKVKNGKLDPKPLIVEGMACPNGCVGGPGTLAPIRRAQREVKKFAKKAKWEKPKDYLK